jgi:predicted transcriptional regulator
MTKEQELFIKENYKKISAKEIAKILLCNKQQVYNIAYGFNLSKKRQDKQYFTTEDDNFIIQRHGKISNAEIAKILNRTIPSINARIKKIRAKSEGKLLVNKKSKTFIDLGKSYYEKLVADKQIKTLDDLAAYLNVSRYVANKIVIKNNIQHLFQQRYKRERKYFTSKEINFLVQHRNKMTADEMAKKLNRTLGSINGRLKKMRFTHKKTDGKQKPMTVSSKRKQKTLFPNKSIEQISYKKAYVRKILNERNIDPEKSIQKNIPYKFQTKLSSFIEYLKHMAVGDSFEFPAESLATMYAAMNFFPERLFKTTKIANNARMIWRLR